MHQFDHTDSSMSKYEETKSNGRLMYGSEPGAGFARGVDQNSVQVGNITFQGTKAASEPTVRTAKSFKVTQQRKMNSSFNQL